METTREGGRIASLSPPPSFNARVFHEIRVKINGRASQRKYLSFLQTRLRLSQKEMLLLLIRSQVEGEAVTCSVCVSSSREESR